MNKEKKQALLPFLLLSALLCIPLPSHAKTVGQEFRDILADIDAQCRKDKLGPYLDKSDPEHGSKQERAECNILIKPADPLATEEGRYAYAIQLPPPHGKLTAQYSAGMSAESYFKNLCAQDAGEWVLKTVDGVDGVFQGRRYIPPTYPLDTYLTFEFREAVEIKKAMEDNLVQPSHGRFNYLERPAAESESGAPYVRLYREDHALGHYKQKDARQARATYVVRKEQADTLSSRYGFTWRQVADKDMLENGIAGGETIVYDRTSNEVLGFRRFFYRYWPRPDSRQTRRANHNACRPAGTPFQFIQKVLVPVNPAE